MTVPVFKHLHCLHSMSMQSNAVSSLVAAFPAAELILLLESILRTPASMTFMQSTGHNLCRLYCMPQA